MRLVAEQSGYVEAIHVKEGQLVTPQTVLISLSQKHAASSDDDSYKQIEKLLLARDASYSNDLLTNKTQTLEQISALSARKQALLDEERSTSGQIRLQEARVELAEANMKTFGDLSRSGYISAVQLREKQAELIDLKQRLLDLNRTRRTTIAELDSVKSQLTMVSISAESNDRSIKRNLGQVQQDLAEHSIRAKGNVTPLLEGEVTSISVHRGQYVQTGQTLGWLIPKGGDLIIELHGNSRIAGQAKVGLPVSIRYLAFPYEKFGQGQGVVTEVSQGAVRVDDPFAAIQPNLQNSGEGLYRVRVRPTALPRLANGDPIPLKAGSAVEASIKLEERRIVEWILGPALGAFERI